VGDTFFIKLLLFSILATVLTGGEPDLFMIYGYCMLLAEVVDKFEWLVFVDCLISSFISF